MKEKKAGRAHRICNFLCFSFPGDERMGYFSLVTSFVYHSFSLFGGLWG